MKKAPNPVDRHVGSRVRLRRLLIGMSQEKLGQSLGLTFQQVQKYEKGTNRIGASRLQHIGSILGVDIPYFYEGAPRAEGPVYGEAVGSAPLGFAEEAGAAYSAEFLTTNEGIQLVRAYRRVKDPKVRRRLIELMEVLGEDE